MEAEEKSWEEGGENLCVEESLGVSGFETKGAEEREIDGVGEEGGEVAVLERSLLSSDKRAASLGRREMEGASSDSAAKSSTVGAGAEEEIESSGIDLRAPAEERETGEKECADGAALRLDLEVDLAEAIMIPTGGNTRGT